MNYFAHLPTLSAKPYTDYFLNTFMPLNFKAHEGLFTPFLKKDFIDDPILTELDNLLQTKYNLPPIFYFSIFRHSQPQRIHVDFTGQQHDFRHASLNLPLSGFESTKMIFYKEKQGMSPRLGNDAYFYSLDQVDPIVEFKGSNDWVLVNSGVPHQIIAENLDNPRVTLCIRFEGNPTIDECLEMVRGTGIEPVLTA
jgi:hypothetical protein